MKNTELDHEAEARLRIADARATSATNLDLSGLQISCLPNEIQALTALTSLHLAYCDQVSDLTPIQALTALTSLTLRRCQQVSDLTPIQALTALTSLDLFFCSQVRDLTPIQALTALTSLDLSWCDQVSDLTPIQALTALTSLDLSWCDRVSDLTPIQALTGLTSLNLSGCDQVRDLTPIQALTALTSLNLTSCKQVSDLTPIQALTALTSLNLAYCKQVSDLTPIQALAALTSLNLTNCEQVSDLTPIQALTALTSLNLTYCQQVSDLTPIQALTALTSLNLRGCRQVSDLTPIPALTALTSLNLTWCDQVSDLTPILALHQLESLDLAGMQPDLAFAPLLPLLSTLQELDLRSTRFADLDLSLSGAGDNVATQVRAHFADLAAGQILDRETKVIFLGNGGAGKTQLNRILRGLPYDEDVLTTHGIQVHEAALSLDDPAHPIPLNLWDFGGQEVYHGSHSLFLQGRAIFIVVWTPALETTAPYEEHGVTMHHRPLTYWLDYIRAFSGTSNPLILVQSQCDDRSKKASGLPAALDGFASHQSVQVSAKTGYRLDELHAALRKALRDSFEQREPTPIGKGRVEVRQKLRKMRDQDENLNRFLERQEFDRICEETKAISNHEALLEYLHHSGAVFYRPNLFGGRIILDQNWALQAVYTVFDRKKTLPLLYGNGRFTRQDLETLVWSDYTVEEQKLFLTFMESCGICFAVSERHSEQTIYIAPELLPPQSEAERSLLAGRIPRDAPAESVEASYSFLHEGILRNFLSRIGQKAGDAAVYWKNGCWFYEQTTDSRVLVEGRWNDREQQMGPGSLRLRAWGARAKELLKPLVEELENIPSGQKPSILWSEAKSVANIAKEHSSQNSAATSGLDRMNIQAPTSTSTKPQVFISYAWGSDTQESSPMDKQRGAVVEALCECVAREGWEVQRDTKVMRFGDLISTFIKTISRSDLVIVVLSEKYLQSIFCMTELFSLYQYSRDKKDFHSRIIPLVLSDAKFSAPEERVEWAIHWSTRFEKLDANRRHLGESDAQQVRQMMKWHDAIGDILFHISDTIHAHGFEQIVTDDFAALRQMLQRRQNHTRPLL